MTFEEARFEASVNARANRLWQDGYTAIDLRVDRQEVHVFNEEGTKYIVDVLFGGCTCPCWQKHQICKHERGWQELLCNQQAAEDALCEEYEARAELEANGEDLFSSNGGGSLW